MMKVFRSALFYIGLISGMIFGIVPGFILGVYYLPIIVATEGADDTTLEKARLGGMRQGTFRRNLAGSDRVHWGEGTIYESMEGGQLYYTLDGELSPGPDYKLYLTPQYVETEAAFLAIKHKSVRIAAITGFKNFRVTAPTNITPQTYPALIIWCERFREFITSTRLERAAP